MKFKSKNLKEISDILGVDEIYSCTKNSNEKTEGGMNYVLGLRMCPRKLHFLRNIIIKRQLKLILAKSDVDSLIIIRFQLTSGHMSLCDSERMAYCHEELIFMFGDVIQSLLKTKEKHYVFTTFNFHLNMFLKLPLRQVFSETVRKKILVSILHLNFLLKHSISRKLLKKIFLKNQETLSKLLN